MSTENGENNVKILNEDIMMERGKFTANGYTFTVKPVYLGEKDQYFSDIKISPIPVTKEGDDAPTDKELARWAIALFSEKVNEIERSRKPGILKRFFYRLIFRNDYRYYADKPVAMQLAKWIEKKVTYEGKKIKFYQLEREFGLNKAEVESLIFYLHKLSFFF